jgi:GMP synthase (glutamine-hydrolysing)
MDFRDYHQEIVAILDFGSQYTQLIARKIRELGVYCEIFPYSIGIEKIKSLDPIGVILSGGPRSVNEAGAPVCDPAVFELHAPILGICYGIQLIAKLYGGEVQRSEKREYGRAHIFVDVHGGLLEGMENDDTIWMSHGDSIIRIAEIEYGNYFLVIVTKIHSPAILFCSWAPLW